MPQQGFLNHDVEVIFEVCAGNHIVNQFAQIGSAAHLFQQVVALQAIYQGEDIYLHALVEELADGAKDQLVSSLVEVFLFHHLDPLAHDIGIDQHGGKNGGFSVYVRWKAAFRDFGWFGGVRFFCHYGFLSGSSGVMKVLQHRFWHKIFQVSSQVCHLPYHR